MPGWSYGQKLHTYWVHLRLWLCAVHWCGPLLKDQVLEATDWSWEQMQLPPPHPNQHPSHLLEYSTSCSTLTNHLPPTKQPVTSLSSCTCLHNASDNMEVCCCIQTVTSTQVFMLPHYLPCLSIKKKWLWCYYRYPPSSRCGLAIIAKLNPHWENTASDFSTEILSVFNHICRCPT